MLNRAAPVLFVQGILLSILAATMLPALWLMYADASPQRGGFAIGVAITLGSGLLLALSSGRQQFNLSIRQMFVLTTASWSSICLFGAMPLYFGIDHLSFTDAVFESVSGITTTGATVLSGLDDMPRGILLWRAMQHWIGGIGIVVIAIAILPFLSIGGMKLFKTESSDWSDKVAPRAGSVAKSVAVVYLALSLLCMGGYLLGGMGWFDAISHAMSTVSTGGFSNYDASFGHFAEMPVILWTAIIFMLLGGMPFTLYVALLRNRRVDLFRDQQVRGFLTTATAISLTLFVALLFVSDMRADQLLTHAVFNVVSILTTTGFASTDYTQWGPFAIAIFFIISFIGGCSGSTSGGLKIFRLQIGVVLLNHQLKQLLHSNGVFTQKYNGRRISDELVSSITAFSFFFLITIAVLTLLLAALGLDLVTALTGAASAVANVGPGLGHIIGPAGNFQPLPDTAKWLLSIGMLLGRLEIMTVLVLFTSAFWRW
jgi:trk system potassium uptake protein TrkH